METKRNYWIHRISHIAHISYPLIHEGYLSYGWSDFAEDGFMSKLSIIAEVPMIGQHNKLDYCRLSTKERIPIWDSIITTRFIG